MIQQLASLLLSTTMSMIYLQAQIRNRAQKKIQVRFTNTFVIILTNFQIGTDNFKDQAKDFEEIKSAKSEDEPDEIDQNKILRNKSNETHNSWTALCKRSLIKDESENDHYSSDNDSTNIKKVNNEIQSDTKGSWRISINTISYNFMLFLCLFLYLSEVSFKNKSI